MKHFVIEFEDSSLPLEKQTNNIGRDENVRCLKGFSPLKLNNLKGFNYRS
jgi:hypothetical protein